MPLSPDHMSQHSFFGALRARGIPMDTDDQRLRVYQAVTYHLRNADPPVKLYTPRGYVRPKKYYLPIHIEMIMEQSYRKVFGGDGIPKS